MLDSIKALFAISPYIAWSIVLTLLSVIVIIALWDTVKWWWTNTWMSFPVIGKISRLSKDLNTDSKDPTWFKSELNLCGDYKKFIRIQDEHDFNEKKEYLAKAGDNGRTPMPAWIWLLTAVLVFAEAMGFSYVLAGWTIPGASESMQQNGALGIAFIVSVILVAFTHWAGQELYITYKIKHARREWAEDGRKGKFTSGVVPLFRPQSTDDGISSYVQLANRMPRVHESFNITIATIFIVIVVAAGATYVRGQVLEKSLHQEVVGVNEQSAQNAAIGTDSLDMSESSADPILPDADVSANQSAKDKEVDDQISIDRHGGWGTFIILAFIFVFLQILGGMFGFKWGFAGQDSKSAFKSIGNGRYTTYSEVRDHYEEVGDVAQSKLENLQQRLMERNANIGNEGMHTKNTFWNYMSKNRNQKSVDRADQQQYTQKEAAYSKANIKPVAEIKSVVEKAPISEKLTVDEAVAHLDSYRTDKEAKLTYLESLPEHFRAEVTKTLRKNKELKANNEKRTQMAADLDGLI